MRGSGLPLDLTQSVSKKPQKKTISRTTRHDYSFSGFPNQKNHLRKKVRAGDHSRRAFKGGRRDSANPGSKDRGGWEALCQWPPERYSQSDTDRSIASSFLKMIFREVNIIN